MNLPRPTCERCKRPVNDATWTPLANGTYLLVVTCHGQREACVLQRSFIEDFDPHSLISISATAFSATPNDDIMKLSKERR
jgi:hypothetical protein